MAIIKAIIAPSVLAADLANLAEDSKRIIKNGADYLHLDIMDGHFVPNLSFGPPVIKSLRKSFGDHKVFFDCHLMVSNPEFWVDDMKDAGADNFTFHYEATENPIDLINKIHSAKMRCGVSIKPSTPLTDSFLSLLKLVDLCLIMTVEPGFGGQKFDQRQLDKVRRVRELFPDLDIQVDGGVKRVNVEECAVAGANVFVSGTGLFGLEDERGEILFFRETANKHF